MRQRQKIQEVLREVKSVALVVPSGCEESWKDLSLPSKQGFLTESTLSVAEGFQMTGAVVGPPFQYSVIPSILHSVYCVSTLLSRDPRCGYVVPVFLVRRRRDIRASAQLDDAIFEFRQILCGVPGIDDELGRF